MRALLDTHALLWWLADDAQLSAPARAVLADGGNQVLVSAATALEIAVKVRLGRLPPGASELASDFEPQILREGFDLLSFTAEHGIRSGRLPGPHRDPFDRMLVAQAQALGVPIISADRAFDAYGLPRIW